MNHSHLSEEDAFEQCFERTASPRYTFEVPTAELTAAAAAAAAAASASSSSSLPRGTEELHHSSLPSSSSSSAAVPLTTAAAGEESDRAGSDGPVPPPPTAAPCEPASGLHYHRPRALSRPLLLRLPTLSSDFTYAVVELIGTFFLVLTVSLSLQYDTELAPLAVGFMALPLMVSLGYLSGGFFNPAVSLAVWLCSVEEEASRVPDVAATITTATQEAAAEEESTQPAEAAAATSLPPAATTTSALSLKTIPYGDMTTRTLLVHFAAQFGGGILATIYGCMLFGSSLPIPTIDRDNDGSISLSAAMRALVVEALYTFVWCSVVLNAMLLRENVRRRRCQLLRGGAGLGDTPEPSEIHFCGMTVGLALVAGGLASGPISGGVFNPAAIAPLTLVRCGLTLTSSTCGSSVGWLWVYLVGEFAGAIGAAIAYVALQCVSSPIQ